MNKLNFFLAIVFLSVFYSNSVYSQNSKNIHIKFWVNAEAIYNGGSVEDNSELSDDNNGTSPNGRPSDFESKAYASKFVNWEILGMGSNEGDYQLKFLDFPWSGNIDAFAKNPIPGGGKRARAKIEDDSPDGVLKYTIRFTIQSKVTGETRTFELDPKLRIISR